MSEEETRLARVGYNQFQQNTLKNGFSKHDTKPSIATEEG